MSDKYTSMIRDRLRSEFHKLKDSSLGEADNSFLVFSKEVWSSKYLNIAREEMGASIIEDGEYEVKLKKEIAEHFNIARRTFRYKYHCELDKNNFYNPTVELKRIE